jgi:hypothetical protein
VLRSPGLRPSPRGLPRRKVYCWHEDRSRLFVSAAFRLTGIRLHFAPPHRLSLVFPGLPVGRMTHPFRSQVRCRACCSGSLLPPCFASCSSLCPVGCVFDCSLSFAGGNPNGLPQGGVDTPPGCSTARTPSFPTWAFSHTKIGDRDLQNAPGSEVQKIIQTQFLCPRKWNPEKF